ncbi:unnamed protein product [Boreogadus saida]
MPSSQENMYSVVTKSALDREKRSQYDITITAKDTVEKTFQFKVCASDSGTPSLTGNATVNVFILDQNDNAPVILYPTSTNGSAEGVEDIPRNMNAETDEAQHKLVILVKDNGNVSLSATATVVVKLVEPKEAISASDCSKTTDVSSKYLPETNYDGTLCHSIQYRSGEKRYMLVGPRMSIGSTIVPGSNGNTLVVPDRRSTSAENDNPPVILHPLSSNGSAEGVEEVPRNVPAGHLVTKVRAYDADIGYNGWLLFSLQEVSDHSLFGLDRYTGRIRTLRSFTETDEAQHKLVILVKDNGNVSLSATATVVVKLVEPKEAISASDVKSAATDIGDSGVTFYLMITLASVSSLFLISIIVLIAMQCSKTTDVSSKYLPETNYDGTLCHSIQYRSGEKRYMLVGPRMSIGSTIVPGSNGNTLVVPDRRSTSAEDNMYAVVTKSPLDREKQPFYDLTIVAKDAGNPPLSSELTLTIAVSDVNDNNPEFSRNLYTFYLNENNAQGTSLFSVTATDRDEGENAVITYHIIRDDSTDSKITQILNINPENGDIQALQSFDFEKLKMFKFLVLASDGGIPKMNSNVTVNVFILDQNDNAPVILYPLSSNGSAEGVEETARNMKAGHLVTKVRAYDADVGYNGWLLFSFELVTDHHSLFGLDRYTGRIRTLRSFTETDEAQHKLVILVKDNGNVSLSATATVVVKVVEPKEAISASDVKSVSKADDESNVTFYLMITLGSVSALFIASIIMLVVMQCSKPRELSAAKYLQETNYDGTLCHSIQYRSGEKRYMLVGPRMSIGSTIVPGSNGNTLVVPDRRSTSTENPLVLSLSMVLEETAAVHDVQAIRFSITEEVEKGTVVGNIAKDLGLDTNSLKERGCRIVPGSTESLFQVNQHDGLLYVEEIIDREAVCERTIPCLINLKTVLENPLEIHYVVVEVLDVNDHSPSFSEKEACLEISESGLPGLRIQLQAARDSDVGVEEVPRNVPAGHLVTKVRAYDADIGYNGWLLFSQQEVSDHSLFGLDRYTGRIRTLRSFTETDEAQHKLVILVKDNGNVSLSATATVVVKLVEPKEAISASDVKSVSKADDESNVTFYLMITLGSVSALFIASIIMLVLMQCSKPRELSAAKYLQETNYDGTLCHSIQYRSGEKRYMLVGPRMSIGSTIVPGSNGNTLVVPDRRSTLAEVRYSISEDIKRGSIVGNVAKDLGFDVAILKERGFRIVSGSKEPYFEINQNDGNLYVSQAVDRERMCERSIVCLVNLKTVLENPLEIHYVSVEENMYSVVTKSALDREKRSQYDVTITAKDTGDINNLATFLNINPENGEILALKSFDFEVAKTFNFKVCASDSGTPSLSSNATVNVFILDQNDNAPVILYPTSTNGSAEGVEDIPRNVNAGHLVSKVRAYDADIGYNGWLLFSIKRITDHSLFGLDRYTGRIRTLRSFTETDEAQHKLVILVKDNGNVSLSATATVIVKLVEPKEAISASDVKSAATDIGDRGVTFYLMITLASVSTLFLISIIVLIAMHCSKTTDVSSKYLPETNYDGTLCHSIQYRSGEKRYMLVGPRMSIGSTIVPGSNGNTLVVPDRRSTSAECLPYG